METPTTAPKKSNKLLTAVLCIVVIIGYFMYISGGDVKLAQPKMQQIENQVAEDAVKQYEIAQRQGDKIQIAVQAGLVAAAYLQAKDEANYDKWKAIQNQDEKAAGMNR